MGRCRMVGERGNVAFGWRRQWRRVSVPVGSAAGVERVLLVAVRRAIVAEMAPIRWADRGLGREDDDVMEEQRKVAYSPAEEEIDDEDEDFDDVKTSGITHDIAYAVFPGERLVDSAAIWATIILFYGL